MGVLMAVEQHLSGIDPLDALERDGGVVDVGRAAARCHLGLKQKTKKKETRCEDVNGGATSGCKHQSASD